LLLFETTHLFFDQYAFKLNINNSCATIFIGKDFRHARKKLDKLQADADAKRPLLLFPGTYRDQTVSLEAFENAKKLYQIFNNTEVDYKLRIEKPTISIYSNNDAWLEDIASTLKVEGEMWRPNDAYVDILDDHVLLVSNNNGHQYRCTLGQNAKNNCNWLINNQDKVKIGPVLKKAIRTGLNVEGLYFYVRDEKILQLISLCGINLRRVDRLVVKQN